MYAMLACTKQKHAWCAQKYTFTYSKNAHVNFQLFKPLLPITTKTVHWYLGEKIFLNHFQLVLRWIITI